MMWRVTGLARKDAVPEKCDKNLFLRPCDSNHSAGRAEGPCLFLASAGSEVNGGAMKKRKSPLLRWAEETERRRVLEFAALRDCERVWPAERAEPSNMLFYDFNELGI